MDRTGEGGITLIASKFAKIVMVSFTYVFYLVWDYYHHELLARTISKNMVWLAFRYRGGSFQYSWDLIILTSIFFGLLVISSKRDIKVHWIVAFIVCQ